MTDGMRHLPYGQAVNSNLATLAHVIYLQLPSKWLLNRYSYFMNFSA